MAEWIDLNAPDSRDTRQLARTLREGRIARARKEAIGICAQSKLGQLVNRAYTPAVADTLGWFLTFATGLGVGIAITVVAVTR